MEVCSEVEVSGCLLALTRWWPQMVALVTGHRGVVSCDDRLHKGQVLRLQVQLHCLGQTQGLISQLGHFCHLLRAGCNAHVELSCVSEEVLYKRC